MVALRNVKSQKSKLHLVDMETNDACQKWFKISRGAGRAKFFFIIFFFFAFYKAFYSNTNTILVINKK